MVLKFIVENSKEESIQFNLDKSNWLVSQVNLVRVCLGILQLESTIQMTQGETFGIDWEIRASKQIFKSLPVLIDCFELHQVRDFQFRSSFQQFIFTFLSLQFYWSFESCFQQFSKESSCWFCWIDHHRLFSLTQYHHQIPPLILPFKLLLLCNL